MSKLNSKEIDYIIDTYKKLKSIQKTVKETGYSKNTVNRYVMDISSQDKRSRNCKNKILQIDINTKEVIKEWYKPATASKELNINPSEICRVLKGELKQAGGYSWIYKK